LGKVAKGRVVRHGEKELILGRRRGYDTRRVGGCCRGIVWEKTLELEKRGEFLNKTTKCE
jgi:hypothetical protein